MSDVTHLLQSMADGNSLAAEVLITLVYSELRNLAAVRMAREQPGNTLQPTALVHEAWLRLSSSPGPAYRDRGHFFACAAEAMRRILIERARRRRAAKRGGGIVPLDIEELEIAAPAADDESLLALNEALERFAVQHPEKAELIKLRYFVGLDFQETADALGIAVPTAKKWWAYGRACLVADLQGLNPRPDPNS